MAACREVGVGMSKMREQGMEREGERQRIIFFGV